MNVFKGLKRIGGDDMKPYIISNDDRDYTDTIKFQKKKQEWKNAGMSETDIEELTSIYSNTEIAYNVSELGYENCVSETVIFGKEALQQNSLVNKKFLC